MLWHDSTFLCVWCMCQSRIACQVWFWQSCTLYSGAPYLDFFTFEPNLGLGGLGEGGVPYIYIPEALCSMNITVVKFTSKTAKSNFILKVEYRWLLKTYFLLQRLSKAPLADVLQWGSYWNRSRNKQYTHHLFFYTILLWLCPMHKSLT